MPKQPELFPNGALDVSPAPDRLEPWLWVRRLAIWSEPGVLIRDIRLRRGLNVIWSPDPAEDAMTAAIASTLGHGSGKTLFCRLLRYCLGESRFAAEDQRERIAETFNEGFVNAEVVLLGTTWAIQRPLGHRRRHVAIKNRDLDSLSSDEQEQGSFDDFCLAVEQALVSSDLSAALPGSQPFRGWLSALAWLSRDQECRFDHVLDWRSAASGSDSPVRDFSRAQVLDAMRGCVEGSVPEEQAARNDLERIVLARRESEERLGHIKWSVDQAKAKLIHFLDADGIVLPELPLLAVELRDRAESLVRTLSAQLGGSILDLRAKESAQRNIVHSFETAIAKIDGAVNAIDRALGNLRAERPGASAKVLEGDEPVCPICEVPIDRSLAEGCGLSHRLPNLETLRQRLERLDRQIADETRELQSSKAERSSLQQGLAMSRAALVELQTTLEAAEKTHSGREEQLQASRQAVRDAIALGDLFQLSQALSAEIGQLVEQVDTVRSAVSERRSQHDEIYQRLSQHFDAIVRFLAGSEASGRVALTGVGLDLRILWGGDRSTAALESLKVLAFDLAALCLTLEGRTRLPAFLVHDSPREADLGISAYHRLFTWVESLERLGDVPAFQYIITTTTRPPVELSTEPWLCLTLLGDPPEGRLFRRNL